MFYNTSFCVQMLLPEIEIHILAGIVDIMRSYTEFTAGSIRSESGRQEKAKLIRENAAFVADSLMPLVDAKIQVSLYYLSITCQIFCL